MSVESRSMFMCPLIEVERWPFSLQAHGDCSSIVNSKVGGTAVIIRRR